MIVRLTALVIALYALGFAAFAVSLGTPAADDAPATEGMVVLTGAGGRIEGAIERLADGKAERLLVAGADPVVTDADLAEAVGVQKRWFDCCIDVGSESVDTRSNAEEAERWLDAKGYDGPVRLVTSDWHMRRAAFEFRRELGEERTLVLDAVPTEPSLMTLFGEYTKYVLRRAGLLVGL